MRSRTGQSTYTTATVEKGINNMNIDKKSTLCALLVEQKKELCEYYCHHEKLDDCCIMRHPCGSSNIAPDDIEWCPATWNHGDVCMIEQLVIELLGC